MLLLGHSRWPADGLHASGDNVSDVAAILLLRVADEGKGGVVGAQDVLLAVLADDNGEAADLHAAEEFRDLEWRREGNLSDCCDDSGNEEEELRRRMNLNWLVMMMRM